MSEDKLQSECYLWFHNEFPELRGLLCYNLNNSMNKIRGMTDKAMGLQPGRSDMVFYYKGQAFMIEFKTLDGVKSKNQKEWQKVIERSGFSYSIVKSLDEFQTLILRLIK